MFSRKLFSRLRNHNREDGKNLRQFVAEHIEEIINYLPMHIMADNGDDDVNITFTGLSDSPNDVAYKIQVVDIVLKVLRENPTTHKHYESLASRVRLELPRLPPHDVIRWCDESVNSIVDDSDINMIWCVLLPECLNTILALEQIEHNGMIIPSKRYKEQCLENLLECTWQQKQLVRLATMFRDLQLTKQEHRKCVMKICSYLKDMAPDSLPPLVHELLKLCRRHNMEVVLAHVSHYFNLRLYNRFTVSQDSESTTIDVDGIEEYSTADLTSCMSTCLMFCKDEEAALRQLKDWARSQLPREPFLLTLGLALNDRGKEFRTSCLEAVKAAIEQTVTDEIKCEKSFAIKSLLPSSVTASVRTLPELLEELTDRSQQHQFTMMGLIDLGFALLGGKRGEDGRVARRCAQCGARVLCRMARAVHGTEAKILSMLADRLAVDGARPQYAECLQSLCKLVSVEQCPQLTEILSSCQPNAPAVLQAVHPLLNYSSRVRDALVLVCRKGLYSNNTAQRSLAVCGILTVLKHLRISEGGENAAVLFSQDDEIASQSHGFSQTIDVHATQQNSVSSSVRNRTICLEMLSILQRCFMQDAPVRQLLYTRWYSCVKDKPSLHETILETLNHHLSKYLPKDGPCNLLLDECVKINGSTPELVEPIGHLLFLIAQMVQPGSVESNIEDIFSSQQEVGSLLRTKFRNLLADLSSCDLLEQFNMEDLKLTELTPESKANCIKVQQVLQVYEALIAHHIMQWNASKGYANVVYQLYKAHNQMVDNTKTPTKAAKKASKLNDTQDSVKSTKSKKGAGGKENVRKGPKDKSGPFKPLPCLWDMGCCYRILELLNGEEVSWSSEEERLSLSRRGVFQRWAARAACGALQRVVAANDSYASAQARAHIPRIAALLYNSSLKKFQNLYEFDDETALGRLEAFHACLTLYCQPTFHSHVKHFLAKITGKESDSSAEHKATILAAVREALVEAETIDHSQGSSATNKKVLKQLADIAVVLLQLPTDSHNKLNTQLELLEKYVRDNEHECMALVVQLLETAAAESCEATLLDDLLIRLATVLGTEDDEDMESQTSEYNVPFSWVAGGNAHALMGHVCAHIDTRLANTKYILARAKDLARTLAVAVDDNRELIEKERSALLRGAVVELCQAARWIRALCDLRAGVTSVRALKLATKLYALAADLARHLAAPVSAPTAPTAPAADAKLENLVQMIGDQLTCSVRTLLQYLETGEHLKRGAQLPRRVVEEAERCRLQMLAHDKKGVANYGQYLSERISTCIRLEARAQDGSGHESGMDQSADQSGDDTRDDMEID